MTSITPRLRRSLAVAADCVIDTPRPPTSRLAAFSLADDPSTAFTDARAVIDLERPR